MKTKEIKLAGWYAVKRRPDSDEEAEIVRVSDRLVFIAGIKANDLIPEWMKDDADDYDSPEKRLEIYIVGSEIGRHLSEFEKAYPNAIWSEMIDPSSFLEKGC